MLDTLQDVLSIALGKYHALGFTLEEPDDHILVLKHNSQTIAWFTQVAATKTIIKAYCQSYWERVVLAN